MLYSLVAIVMIAVLFIIIGFGSSRNVKLNETTLEIGINTTIVHISDTHFRDEISLERYQQTIEDINNQAPQILLFTGDMFEIDDPSEDVVEQATEFFNSFQADYKFAVLGNHDYDTEMKRLLVQSILETTGFTVLVNQQDVITINDQIINIIGLDDLSFGDTDYQTVLETTQNYEYNLVLSHEPDTFDEVHPYSVQAMFSGHSHGGQIRVPWIGPIVKVPGATTYSERFYTKNNTQLRVSFGLGQSLINIRFYNPPQMEFYKCS